MKSIINLRHFVTNAICCDHGQRIKCRLRIDFDRCSDGEFLVTKNYLKRCSVLYSGHDYIDAMDVFKRYIDLFLM